MCIMDFGENFDFENLLLIDYIEDSKEVGEQLINTHVQNEVDLIDGHLFINEVTVENEPLELTLSEECQIQDKKECFTCFKCGNLFDCKSNLKCHMKTHYRKKLLDRSKQSAVKKVYTCNFCKKSFTRFSILRHHELTHTGQKLYKCNFCERSFYHLSSLKRHKSIHNGLKPYDCIFCVKTFYRLDDLMRHETIHIGKCTYKCEVCYKTFARKDSFNNHKRFHSGVRHYKCDECNNAYRHLKSLKFHKRRTHNGENLLCCDICKMTFSEKKTLVDHLKNHSRETLTHVQCSPATADQLC